jgi:hypothetical protein
MSINILKNKSGSILVSVIIFAAIAVTMTIGLVNWGASLLQSVRLVAAREQALQIAEAGIDYYRWHLAHAPTDYYDGTNSTSTSPYTHDFYDKNGNLLGTYALTITPPKVGSTIVTIISKGTLASSTVSRSLKVTMAIPSFAQYATIANDVMYFGSGTVTYGPIQSNKGIHFDGVAHGPVSSALSTYVDPDYGTKEWAVYTTSGANDPQPPTPLPTRADVFTVGRQLSIPAIDFSSLTANLATLKSQAQSGGIYLAQSEYTYSYSCGTRRNPRTCTRTTNGYGYDLKFKTNNTFDLYVVTAIETPNNYYCGADYTASNQTQWGLWSVNSEQFVQNYTIPANGVVFLEDNAWVEGQIDGSRVSVVSAVLPDPGAASEPSININHNLLYSHTDGTDSIGLISQGNINIGYDSADYLTIDAALIAQNGRVGRYYYNYYCGSSYIRNTVSLYGMIATNNRYGFAYSDGTGYTNRDINYDANLLYGPPPSFPLTSSYYTTLSWQEI